MTRRLPIAVLALAGCVGTIPHPDERDLVVARSLAHDATLDRLAEGRRLYVGKCSSCHALHAPRERDDPGWRKVVETEMAGRARISRDEADRILLYLCAVNDRPSG
ncbi:MAG: cytochrome c [Planctomycetales bacterium]|nr:cytochrome c [Planctomycetales bacterium]